jgi:hypothetical protein
MIEVMSFAEIELQVEVMSPEQQRKLMALLVSLELRRDETLCAELGRRLDDRSPGAWVSLDEVERRLGLKT